MAGKNFRTLWIDAICINQADIEERGYQVQLMGNIYRECKRALIWLGDSDDNAQGAFKSLEMAFQDMVDRTKDYSTVKEAAHAGAWNVDFKVDHARSEYLVRDGFDIDKTLKFFERPWFSRLWVCTLAWKID